MVGGAEEEHFPDSDDESDSDDDFDVLRKMLRPGGEPATVQFEIPPYPGSGPGAIGDQPSWHPHMITMFIYKGSLVIADTSQDAWYNQSNPQNWYNYRAFINYVAFTLGGGQGMAAVPVKFIGEIFPKAAMMSDIWLKYAKSRELFLDDAGCSQSCDWWGMFLVEGTVTPCGYLAKFIGGRGGTGGRFYHNIGSSTKVITDQQFIATVEHIVAKMNSVTEGTLGDLITVILGMDTRINYSLYKNNSKVQTALKSLRHICGERERKPSSIGEAQSATMKGSHGMVAAAGHLSSGWNDQITSEQAAKGEGQTAITEGICTRYDSALACGVIPAGFETEGSAGLSLLTQNNGITSPPSEWTACVGDLCVKLNDHCAVTVLSPVYV